MTNKEAIERLNLMQKRCCNGYDAEAINCSIKALEERPHGERAERALAIIDRLRTDGHINNKEQGTLRRAILLPERQQGEWISTERGYECSKCGTLHVDDYPFCHMCGADMGGDGE